jgi:hypothetical protein
MRNDGFSYDPLNGAQDLPGSRRIARYSFLAASAVPPRVPLLPEESGSERAILLFSCELVALLPEPRHEALKFF